MSWSCLYLIHYQTVLMNPVGYFHVLSHFFETSSSKHPPLVWFFTAAYRRPYTFISMVQGLQFNGKNLPFPSSASPGDSSNLCSYRYLALQARARYHRTLLKSPSESNIYSWHYRTISFSGIISKLAPSSWE